MKRRIYSSILACIMAGLIYFPTSLLGKQHDRPCEGDDIIIKQRPDNPIGGPRSSSQTVFFASLEDYYVLLGSYTPCGDVDVTLSSTAGDFYTSVFDSQNGTTILPISGNSGHYTITLITEQGQIFDGEFYIY